MPRPVVCLADCLLAAILGACADYVPPYYQFSAASREWQQFQAGTVWTFVNSRGAQNRFRIDSAVTREHRPEYLLIGVFNSTRSNKVNYYYDYWYMRVSSLDSAKQVGNFKMNGGGKNGPVQFHLDSDWATYLGVDSGSGGFIPCWLNFPTDLRQANFQELTVSGRRYTHVLELVAAGKPTRYNEYGVRTSVRRLYYDQQAGVIRLVEDDGEVWNRLP